MIRFVGGDVDVDEMLGALLLERVERWGGVPVCWLCRFV